MVSIGMSMLRDGLGTAEPAYGQSPVQGVVSGHDTRRPQDPQYMFQIFAGTQGGPATGESDGWLTFLVTGGCGISYIDSSEVCEQKYPLIVWEKAVRLDSEGAGRTRGAPGNVAIYGPLYADAEVQYFHDGVVNRAVGVHGGGSPSGPEAWRISRDGGWEMYQHIVVEVVLEPGESIVSLSAGGGGYGSPLAREPEAVLVDVIDGYVSAERARAVYGVVLSGDPARWETLAVDQPATTALRAGRRGGGALALAQDDAARAAQEELNWWVAR
jgi:N-methylhydantoinase B